MGVREACESICRICRDAQALCDYDLCLGRCLEALGKEVVGGEG